MSRRVALSVRDEILREAGYMCGNPRCRHILTLQLHHIVWVRDSGGNRATNLIALCPNCHSLHTAGYIPGSAIRHWKGLLHALNHAFNKEAMDLLLYLRGDHVESVWYSGDGFLKFAGLVAAGLVEIADVVHVRGKEEKGARFNAVMAGAAGPVPYARPPATAVRVRLTPKARALVTSWLAGDEEGYRKVLHEHGEERPKNRLQRTKPTQASKLRR